MMLSTLVWLIAVLLSVPAVRMASQRAAAQPFPIDTESEDIVVRGAHADWLDEAQLLTADMFTTTERSTQWQRFLDGEPATDTPTIPHDQWILAGSRVITAAADRDLLTGRGTVVVSPEGVPSRQPTPITWYRYVFAVFATTITGAVLVASQLPVLVNVAAALMTLAAVVVALVDWDTLYVDFPALGVATVAGTAGAVAGWGAGSVPALMVSLGFLGALGVLFVVYRILRGVWGMAGGDILLMPAFVVAPAMFTQTPALVLWSFLAALLLSLGGYAATHRQGKDVPYAFGPYLVFGWVAALALLNFTNLGSFLV